jgi:uncharacterized protein (TIGR03083 family)
MSFLEEWIMAEQTVQTKDDLLYHLSADRQQLEQAINGLSEEELTRPGPEGWSVKDHLAHIIVWERSGLALMAGEDRAAAVGIDRDFYENGETDAQNEILYQQHKDRSLDDVLAEFREVRAKTIEAVSQLSDEELHQPYSHFQPSDPSNQTPAIEVIIGNSTEHDLEHLEWIRGILEANR